MGSTALFSAVTRPITMNVRSLLRCETVFEMIWTPSSRKNIILQVCIYSCFQNHLLFVCFGSFQGQVYWHVAFTLRLRYSYYGCGNVLFIVHGYAVLIVSETDGFSLRICLHIVIKSLISIVGELMGTCGLLIVEGWMNMLRIRPTHRLPTWHKWETLIWCLKRGWLNATYTVPSSMDRLGLVFFNVASLSMQYS